MRAILLATIGALAAFAAGAADVAIIAPRALVERLAWGDQSLVVLDVRTPEEYRQGHVAGARNIPHTELPSRLAELEDARDADIVVYCRSGNRTKIALDTLDKAGFRRLLHLEGDWQRWDAEGRPSVKPQPSQ
ncbi:MAG: rhodanese-like domain-containing protein [Gammaproteobacteria bacterium]